MPCPCEDENGNIVMVPAKTKEMVYRMKSPAMQKAIAKDIVANNRPTRKGGGG